MNSKDNIYANTDERILFLSDDIDNESVGSITWNILRLIKSDDEKDKKKRKIIGVNQLNCISTLMVVLFMICGD